MFAPVTQEEQVVTPQIHVETPSVTPVSPPLSAKRHTTWALFGLVLCLSFSTSSYGVILPIVIGEFGISLTQAGALSTLRGLGGLGALVVGGIWMNRLGTRWTALLASAMFAFGLLLTSVAPVYSAILVGFALFGGGGSLLDATANAAVADLHVDNRRMYISLLYSLFSIGALVGPATIGAALSIGISWRAVYIALATVTLSVAVFFRSVSVVIPALHRRIKSPKANESQRRNLKPLAVGAATIAVYYGSQITTAAWLPMYFSLELQAGPLISGLSVTLFWTGIGIGRSQMRSILEKIGERRLIQIAGLISTPFMIGALLSNNQWVTLIMILVNGILSGPIYPACMNYAFNQYPEGTGRASSLMTISATLTGLTVPYITGMWAETLGLRTALWIVPALLIVSSFIGLLLPKEQPVEEGPETAVNAETAI